VPDYPVGATLDSGGAEILDDPEALRARDTSGALLGAASGGAQIRAVATAVESGALRSLEGFRPRALSWVAGRSSQSAAAAGLVSALLERYEDGPGIPFSVSHELPAWVGALDVVVVSGADAGDPVAARAVASARARGAAVVVDVPREGPVAEAGGEGEAVCWFPPLPFVAPDRAFVRHAAAGLAVFGALGWAVPPLAVLADRVDEAIASNGPDLAVAVNPAKLAAREIAAAGFPLLVHEDAVSGALARRMVAAFAEAGTQLTEMPLADALRVAPLLRARAARAADAETPDDIFHDEFIDGPRKASGAPSLVPTFLGLAVAAPRERVEQLAAALESVSWVDFGDTPGDDGSGENPSGGTPESQAREGYSLGGSGLGSSLDFGELLEGALVTAACAEIAAAYAALLNLMD